MPTFQLNSVLVGGTYAGDYNWNTGLNWDSGTVPTDGANLVLPTLSVAYTSVDDIPFIQGLNLSIGNNVTLIIALGDTSVENINQFGSNSLFETAGTAIVSIGNGLGGNYAVVGPTANMDITGFNGVGTFNLFGGTINFENNANLSAGNSFNFEGDSNGNLEISSPNNYQNGWSYSVTNFGLLDTISFGTSVFAPGTYSDVYDAIAHTLTIPKAGGGFYVFNNFSLAAGAPTTFQVSGTSVTDVACFAANTRIRVPGGEVAVETLKRGDLVLTSTGSAASVSWVGVQTVSTRFAHRLRVLPIRIKAGALADNVPSRDLLISPDHAILIDDALFQAGALVNGVSIVREVRVPEVFVYYHIETDDHSLILAEDTPAETFIDNVDRMGFDNWAEHEALYPTGKVMEELPYPRAKSHRQVPMRIRAKLAERAGAFVDEVVAA